MMIPMIMITENFKNVGYDALYIPVFTIHYFTTVFNSVKGIAHGCHGVAKSVLCHPEERFPATEGLLCRRRDASLRSARHDSILSSDLL